MSVYETPRARSRRRRRYVHPVVLSILRPAFRLSASRDAFVLRLVGNRFGPVLRPSYQKRTRTLQAN
jgi:hypothetical protein